MVEPTVCFKSYSSNSGSFDPANGYYERFSVQKMIKSEHKPINEIVPVCVNGSQGMPQTITYCQKLPIHPVIARIQQSQSIAKAMRDKKEAEDI